MDFLGLLRAHSQKPSKQKGASLSINLITNFTDDVLLKVLSGMCKIEGFMPLIHNVPYKQYHLALKNKKDPVYKTKPNISFVFFDINPYQHGEFGEPSHLEDALADIQSYCEAIGSTVVVTLAILPYGSAYGHHFEEDPLFELATEWNEKLRALSKQVANIYLFDPNKIVHKLGESHVRDMRGSYAFDIPFSNDFLVALCEEWFACIRAITGRSKKVLVLDLDNTLWGGIVGEMGPKGIALGPGYPGIAFQNFQRAILSLTKRGVILAINSKNNLADVEEVFKKNPHMILKENHFAAIRANWDEKSSNIESIAKELNVGTDSMVFLDDNPLEREKVRLSHPEVLVPEFSLPPEQYIDALLQLKVFHQMSLTEEDKRKSQMYGEERKRSSVVSHAKNKDEYMKQLGIVMKVRENDASEIPRIAQLTQKTNQFNLTTKRYSEADIRKFIKNGWRTYSVEVSDKFGGYGVVLAALVEIKKKAATLDTFLMSCRVLGRDVESSFLIYVIKKLHKLGIETLHASFVPTAKNAPSRDFLSGMKPTKIQKRGQTYLYKFDIPKYLKVSTHKSRVTIED